MKPLFLSIAGLNSFREKQEIDFAQLSETGVFGIFGPTGSGKSSILDAITLALFGDVERAVSNTQGIINNSEQLAQVSFLFQLGYRGQEKKYRVERVYQRAEGKDSVRNKLSRLLEYHGEVPIVMAENATAVTKGVEDLLGLTAQDFKRAVVLPQGKFAEFLRLSGKDRGAMLERLFNLEAYGKILTQRLKDKYDLLTTELGGITGEQLGIGDASPETIQLIEEKLTKATAVEKELACQLTNLENELQQKKELWNLINEESRLQEQLKDALENEQTIFLLEEKVKKAQEAEGLAPYLEAQAETNKALTEATARLASCKEEFLIAEQVYRQKEEEFSQVSNIRREEEPKLITRQGILQQGIELAREIELAAGELKALNREKAALTTKSTNLTANINEIETKKVKQRQLKDELSKRLAAISVPINYRQQLYHALSLQTAAKTKQKQLRQLNDKIKDKNGELSKIIIDLKELQLAIKTLLDQQKLITGTLTQLEQEKPLGEKELVNRWQVLASAEETVKSLERTEKELSQIQVEGETLDKEAKGLKQALQKFKNDLEILEINKNKMYAAESSLTEKLKELEQANMAALLARELKADTPCPVCGSQEHQGPIIHDQVTLDQIAVVEKELAQAKDKIATLEGQIASCNNNLFELSTKESIINDSVVKMNLKEEEGLAELELLRSQLPDDIRRWQLAELKEYVIKEKVNLKEFESQKEKLIKLEKREAQLIVEEKGASKTIGELKFELTELEGGLNIEEKELTDACEKIGVTIEELAVKKEELEEWDEESQLIEVKMTALTREIEELEELSTNLTKDKGEIERNLTTIVATLEVQEKQFQVKKEKLDIITAGKCPSQEYDKTTIELSAILQKEETAIAAKREADAVFKVCQEAFVLAEKQKQNETARLEKVKLQVSYKLKKTSFATWQEAEEAILEKDELRSIEIKCSDYREKIKDLKSQLQRFSRKINGRSLIEADLLDGQAKLDTVKGEMNTAVGERGALFRELEQLQERHLRWKELESKRVKLVTVKGRVEELQQLLKGNSFVKYMAAERMGLIARDASNRLAQLTGNRYALEINSEDSFIIRDNQNGGMRRPVHTLSGGETFLTSLALALALSAQIQLKGQVPLEFFFLDEGFGTLDPELLEVVMSTLERLHLEHLTIGIISHVPELKARLARRLVVIGGNQLGKGTTVKIEIG